MTAHALFNDVIDEIDGEGRPGVFSQRIILIEWHACLLIKHYILINRAKAHGMPDLRLILLREINTLCITAALKVEDAIFAPAMLIITNQAAIRVGRKACLASS